MLTFMVEVKCPYCDFENKRRVDFKESSIMEVWYCDSEEGGCDRRFVVDVFLAQEIKAKKIEGEPEDKELAF